MNELVDYTTTSQINSLISLLHHKMYSESVSSDIKKAPWSKLLTMEPEMKTLFDNIFPPISPPSKMQIFQKELYRFCHQPVAWCQFIHQTIKDAQSTSSPTPRCAFWGEFKNHHKMAIGRPIPISKFKKVAKFHGGNINDLFMTTSQGALRRYAERMNCPIFNSDDFDGTVNHFIPISRRGHSTQSMIRNLREFAEIGVNANELAHGPLRADLKNANVPDVVKAFHGSKYGASADVMHALGNAMSPNMMAEIFKPEKLPETQPVLTTSNVHGPHQPLPIPIEAGTERDENGFVQILFGMASTPMLHIFTLMSYGESLRVGIISNSGNIENPEILIQFFTEQCEEYEAKFDAQRTEEV